MDDQERDLSSAKVATLPFDISYLRRNPQDPGSEAAAPRQYSAEQEALPVEWLRAGTPDKKRTLSGRNRSTTPHRSKQKQRIIDIYGDNYSDEGIADIEDGTFGIKLGLAQTPEKKREILRSYYGKNADVKLYPARADDEEDLYIATKDGTTWKNLKGWDEMVQEVGPTVAEIGGQALGYAGASALLGPGAFAAAGGLVVGAVAIGAATVGQELLLKSLYEPQRNVDADVLAKRAGLASATSVGFGAVGETAKWALSRFVPSFTVGNINPGDVAAQKAAKAEGMMPLTRGQLYDTPGATQTYRQAQAMNAATARESLKRFKSLGDKLGDMAGKYDLETMFSSEELGSMMSVAADNITETLQKSVSASADTLPELMTRMQKNADTFYKAGRVARDKKYREAFDLAIDEGIELDLNPLKELKDELFNGVPLTPKAPGSEPVRLLAPDGDLATLLNTLDDVSDVLSPINPDGKFVSSVEQIYSIRRAASEIAFNDSNPNQARMASMVLEAIDEAMVSPLSAVADPAYLDTLTEAMGMHQGLKMVQDMKSMSKLGKMTVESYRTTMAEMTAPGKGPLLMDLNNSMFKAQPQIATDLRAAFVNNLMEKPGNINRYLDDVLAKDPKLMEFMLNPAEEKALREYGDKMFRLNGTWASKTAERKMHSGAAAARDLFNGTPDVIAERIKELREFGGEEALGHARAAFLLDIFEGAATEQSEYLADKMVSADVVASYLTLNRELVDMLWGAEGSSRAVMDNIAAYSIALSKHTDPSILPRVMNNGMGGGGTSLVVAQQAAKMIHSIGDPAATLNATIGLKVKPAIAALAYGMNKKAPVQGSWSKMLQGGAKLSIDAARYGAESWSRYVEANGEDQDLVPLGP